MLAATTGAPLIPVSLWFEGDGWGLRLNPPVELTGARAARSRAHRDAARWPTCSRPTSPRTRATGTCCRSSAGHLMRIGIVCPYSWDIPGGVQAHVATWPRRSSGTAIRCRCSLPAMTTNRPAAIRSDLGQGGPLPYNGSVRPGSSSALLSASRVRRWLRDGDFDVVQRPRTGDRQSVAAACMMHGRPTCRDLPHGADPFAVSWPSSTPRCSRSSKRSAAGSRSRPPPERSSSSTWGATRW